MTDPVIEPEALARHLADPDLAVLDASWFLPSEDRDGKTAFRDCHIPRAQFFDIDGVADRDTELPHMVPPPEEFARAAASLGISDSSDIVVYDCAGIFSSARVWWMFRVFGHARVRVLNGGLPEWLKQGLVTASGPADAVQGTFSARFDRSALADMAQIQANCEKPVARVLDARPYSRFAGHAPEPRPGLASGHIPGSVSLPFSRLLDEGRMKPAADLARIFDSHGIRPGTPVITSCGSGVTAAIITLALYRCGYGMQQLYDGSWAEWGASDNRFGTCPGK